MSPDAIGGLLAGAMSLIFTLVMVCFGLGVTLISALVPVIILYVVFTAIQKQAQARRELLEQGIRGQATVLSLGETGLRINDQPQANIRLQVRLPDRAPYEATVQMVVSVLQVPRLQPGSVVAVAVDPADPQHLVIDLDQPVEATRSCRYCHRIVPAASTECPSCGAAA